MTVGMSDFEPSDLTKLALFSKNMQTETSGTRTDKTANLEVGNRTPNLFNQTCGEGHAEREHLQTRFEKVSGFGLLKSWLSVLTVC